MIVTLKCITDIYTKPDKQGNQKVKLRNVMFSKQFDTNYLLVEHYLNSRGTPSKKWCLVKQGEEYFKLAHKFEDIEKLTQPVKIKGFI